LVISLTVFDSEGCTSNPVEFTLTKPEPINLSIESRPGISCSGANDGTAIVTPTGGSADYTYLWSNGATTRNIGNLAPGTYTVTVTDTNGCTAESTSAPLTDPPVLTASVASVQDVSCPGEANGIIELTVAGGTMPYSYSTDGINFTSGTTIADLAIGDYDIIISDNNNCTVMVNATINSPATISFDVSSTTNICYGEPVTFTNTSVFTQGNITAVSWDFGAETAMGDNPTTSFTTIGNPTVTLTIMTDLGCETSLTQVLDIAVEPCCEQNNGLSFLPLFEEPLCNGSAEGSITLNPFSVPPITALEWSNNENTEIIENLPAGEYTVTVTNDATCIDSITIVLEEPTPILTTFDLTNPTCDVATNGAIMIEATGGTLDPNGAYEFDFGDGFSTENTQGNLAFGNFSIDVRDDNNCIVTVDTDLIVPDTSPINATLNLVLPTCEAAFNGSITTIVDTGSGSGIGANFVYDFGDGFSPDNSSENLAFGDYSIAIRDIDNCVLTIDTTLAVSATPPITAAIAIVPVSCDIATNGSIRVNATGNSDLVYDFGTGFSTETTAENLPSGDYAIRIRDVDNCELTIDTTLDVSAIPPITANVAINRPSCIEATNGRITVDAVGIGNNMDLWWWCRWFDYGYSSRGIRK